MFQPVKKYEGYYEINTTGVVKSVDRFDSIGRNIKGKLIIPFTTALNYQAVSLCKLGKVRTIKVHRLVAEAFLPNPYNHPEVNHINHNRSDNRIENLEWVTHAGNMSHSKNNKNRRTNSEKIKGALHPRSYAVKRISIANPTEIISYASIPDALAAIGRGRNSSLICAVLKGKRNNAYGYKWEKL